MPISLDIRLLLFAGIGGPSSADAAPGTGASSSAGFVTFAGCLEAVGPGPYGGPCGLLFP
jgi:hypothetical protein